MRPTKRRTRRAAVSVTFTVADYFRLRLTGQITGPAASTYQDYEEYARGLRASE